MEERFKECLFSNNLIGNNGTVKRLDKGKIKRYGTDVLIGLIKADGYKMYFLAGKWYYAHRIVAMHWIPNPGNLSDVNHRDGVKLNNWWINLEWCTHADNIKHSFEALSRTAPRGKDHWCYGKTLPDSQKERMSEAKKGRKREGKSGKWIK